jgi:hypothetical protein
MDIRIDFRRFGTAILSYDFGILAASITNPNSCLAYELKNM